MNYYDVLGVSSTASEDEIRDAYLEKSRQVAPDRFEGAPNEVITAAKKASVVIDAAWHVLGDPSSRAEYDNALNPQHPSDQTHVKRFAWRRHHAEHVWAMEKKLGVPLTSVLGLRPHDREEADQPVTEEGMRASEFSALPYSIDDHLIGFAEWLAPHDTMSAKVAVPNLSGMRASEALWAACKVDLDLEFVRLTDHPSGEGIIVDQDPPAGTRVHRHTTVTVQAVFDSVPPPEHP
jgi:DnaJ domain/PASTA domain